MISCPPEEVRDFKLHIIETGHNKRYQCISNIIYSLLLGHGLRKVIEYLAFRGARFEYHGLWLVPLTRVLTPELSCVSPVRKTVGNKNIMMRFCQ